MKVLADEIQARSFSAKRELQSVEKHTRKALIAMWVPPASTFLPSSAPASASRSLTSCAAGPCGTSAAGRGLRGSGEHSVARQCLFQAAARGILFDSAAPGNGKQGRFRLRMFAEAVACASDCMRQKLTSFALTAFTRHDSRRK